MKADSDAARRDAIVKERGKIYGDPKLSHENIGHVWTALIQQHYGIKLPHTIPSSVVALMLAGMKLSRSTRIYHADNYDDATVYVAFANEFQRAGA